jgi:hypothetical protein
MFNLYILFFFTPRKNTDVKEPNMQNSKVYKKLYNYYAQALIDIEEKKRLTGNL